MEDAILGQWRQFYPETLSRLATEEKAMVHLCERQRNYGSHSGKKRACTIELGSINKALKAEGVKSLNIFRIFVVE